MLAKISKTYTGLMKINSFRATQVSVAGYFPIFNSIDRNSGEHLFRGIIKLTCGAIPEKYIFTQDDKMILESSESIEVTYQVIIFQIDHFHNTLDVGYFSMKRFAPF